MVTKRLAELRRRTDAHSEKCNKEMEDIQMYASELKNTITEVKNNTGENYQEIRGCRRMGQESER